MTPNCGRLFVVGTPIGNLSDLSLRAKEVLKEVKVVVCEDTRRTRKLLSQLGAKARLVSCFEQKEDSCAKDVINMLLEGVDCVYCSDAGTPNVSDPGRRLIEAVYKASIPIIPVPGVSAVTAILSCSPFKGDRFLFAGFLPEKQGPRQEFLRGIKDLECTIVFFEAPHRVKRALRDVMDIIGDRAIVMGRELTKIHEELVLDRVSGLIKRFEQIEPRGEFTFCMEGAKAAAKNEDLETIQEIKALLDLIKHGKYGTRELATLISRISGVKKSTIYNLVVKKGRNEINSADLF